MSLQQIVALLVRIFSVWLVISAIQLFSLGVMFNNSQYDENSFPYYFISGVLIFFAMLLWLFPMTVAHKIIPKAKIDDCLNVSASDVTSIVCFVFGGWLFFSHAFPSILHYISVLIPTLRGARLEQQMDGQSIFLLIKAIFYLVSSIVFIIKKDLITKYILYK